MGVRVRVEFGVEVVGDVEEKTLLGVVEMGKENEERDWDKRGWWRMVVVDGGG